MKIGAIKIERYRYKIRTCLGKMFAFISGKWNFVCHTLEDTDRGDNIKISKETSLASGIYKVILTMSPRFGRLMPVIITEMNGYEAINKGKSFKGSRFHGGNTHKNTEGCPLCAHNISTEGTEEEDKIFGSAESDVTKMLIGMGLKEQSIPLKSGFDYVELIIENK